MSNKNYTQEEIDILVQMKKEGAPSKQIADLLGRSVSSIDNKYWQVNNCEKTKTVAETERKLVKIPKLSDFPPREMIKHLYNLGYRIENNRLVLVRKDYIDIKKIISED